MAWRRGFKFMVNSANRSDSTSLRPVNLHGRPGGGPDRSPHGLEAGNQDRQD